MNSDFEAAQNAIIAGDVDGLERLLRNNPKLLEEEPPPYVPSGPGPDYTKNAARSIIAREHHFQTFEEFIEHARALQCGDPLLCRFEAAIEAIIIGDAPTLKKLLDEEPELIRARSRRTHHATLLHYVGANGVEGFRQKTPRNAVEIAEMLLKSGAEVDAMADMYGGSTTLGLVATSIHPALAGVQSDLIQTLLDHGANIDHPGAGGNGQGVVNGCLANGRPGAAEFLAERGARLDLEGAAGVGRVEAVKGFFDDRGHLRGSATVAQMKSGFNWACEYGRTTVVEFLLGQHSLDLGEKHRGETGLHWAAYGGHADIVRMLLERRAPVDVRDDRWQNTPLGWALYGWEHRPSERSAGKYFEVISLLVAAGAKVDSEWVPSQKLRKDSRMLGALDGAML